MRDDREPGHDEQMLAHPIFMPILDVITSASVMRHVVADPTDADGLRALEEIADGWDRYVAAGFEAVERGVVTTIAQELPEPPEPRPAA